MQTTRLIWLLTACGAIIPPTSNAAITITGSHLTGEVRSVPIYANTQGVVDSISAISYFLSSTDGFYDRILFTNRESAANGGGVYYVDLLPGQSQFVVMPPSSNGEDLSSLSAGFGEFYVGQHGTPVVSRLDGIFSTPTLTPMLENYGLASDDDPISVSYIRYSSKLFVIDRSHDDDLTLAATLVDPWSTAATPSYDTVWSQTLAADEEIHGSFSTVGQWEYLTLGTTPLVDGLASIFRLRTDGVLETIRLAGMTSPLTIDDAIAVNPGDGSIWLPVNTGGTSRTYYRIGVPPADPQPSGTYLANATAELSATSLNVNDNGIVFSPDGSWLAVAAPDGEDVLYLFRTPVPEPSSWALVTLASIVASRRARRRSTTGCGLSR
jgi:hypothetical protein